VRDGPRLMAVPQGDGHSAQLVTQQTGGYPRDNLRRNGPRDELDAEST